MGGRGGSGATAGVPERPREDAQTGTARAAGGSVQSLERAFDLLERMADAGGEVGLSELAAAAGMPLPTTHRLVQTLVTLGYVRRTASRRYAMGPRLIRLGDTASRLLGTWAQPYLAELVDLTGETANMAILDGDGVVYVAQVPSRHSMRMFTEVGRRVSPHCTGVGKAILSQLPQQRVIEILGRLGMPAVTERTITNLGALLRDLALTRERGYAVDDGEQEVGVRCVAMPLRGAPTPAAVSVSGPEGRVLPLFTSDGVVDRMRAVADRLTVALLDGQPGT